MARDPVSRFLPLLVAALLAGCATARPRATPGVEQGVASWYGSDFHGRKTASGASYDMHQMTAAHRTLPFGTVVEVRNLDNGATVEVTITDRGPFKKNRIIDLSYAAARSIGMIGPGTARVELRTLRVPSGPRYVVQAGAFQELALAQALAARLNGDFPQTAVSSDAVWHRVQIGDYATREEAERMRQRVQRAGFAALVVATLGAPPN